MPFALLNWLARDGNIEWSRAIVDSCAVRAVCGGTQTGPNPTDRAKTGSKRHLICDGQGVPLTVRLTGANRNDSQEALALSGCDSACAKSPRPTALSAGLCARAGHAGVSTTLIYAHVLNGVKSPPDRGSWVLRAWWPQLSTSWDAISRVDQFLRPCLRAEDSQ